MKNIKQVIKLLEALEDSSEETNEVDIYRPLGQCIVVLDRGFVYVGTVEEMSDRIRITHAKNIRVWGTTEGLGQLRNGPLQDTKLDVVDEVLAYKHAVIHLIPCKGY